MRRDKSPQPSIAIVYDRATVAHGGAEDVLQILHTAFPDAPLFTSVWNPKLGWTEQWQVTPSLLQKIPFAHHLHRILAPCMPLAFEMLSLTDFDIIFSVSSAEAKGVITKPKQLHVCYLFTPTRYLYEYAEAYGKSAGWHNWLLIKPFVALVRHYLIWWDQQASQRPDIYITLSQRSANKIQKIYKRSSIVVYPPVVIDSNTSDPMLIEALKSLSFALSLSRLVSYKRVQESIESCLAAKIPIIIVGTGPDYNRLIHLYPNQTYVRSRRQTVLDTIRQAFQSKKAIIFVGAVSNAERTSLLLNAKMVLMLGDEDFGITAIQAAVQGIPTIVSSQSGAAELLTNDTNSIQLRNISASAMSKALEKVTSLSKSPIEMRDLTQQTSQEFFIRQIKEIVYDEWRKHMKKYDNIKKGA